MTPREMIEALYRAFNRREIDAVLAALHPEVDWPNGMVGGRVHGRDAVRDYWTEQWKIIDPVVTPHHIDVLDDGQINVEVHQMVHDLNGKLLVDTTVHHVYTFDDAGLITSMQIVEA